VRSTSTSTTSSSSSSSSMIIILLQQHYTTPAKQNIPFSHDNHMMRKRGILVQRTISTFSPPKIALQWCRRTPRTAHQVIIFPLGRATGRRAGWATTNNKYRGKNGRATTGAGGGTTHHPPSIKIRGARRKTKRSNQEGKRRRRREQTAGIEICAVKSISN
jgi:hypothetical protein